VVGGRPIEFSHLEQRIAEVRRGPRGRHLPPEGGSESTDLRRWIVQELVTEAVLGHEARAAGIVEIDGSPGSAVAQLAERVTASVSVPRRDVRAYYVRNRDRYSRREGRRVRHILLSDEWSARKVADRLVAGEDMDTLAAAWSIDAGTRSRGGDLGDVHRGELTGSLEDAIFAAEIGAVIGPIRTEHGWHVARVEAVAPESCVPYGEARPAIEAELLGAERTREFGAWLERRRAAIAVIEPEFEHPAHPDHGFPSHRH
jgi:hypothetical protein